MTHFIHHPIGVLVDADNCPKHDDEAVLLYRNKHGRREPPCRCRMVGRVVYASAEVEAAAIAAMKTAYEETSDPWNVCVRCGSRYGPAGACSRKGRDGRRNCQGGRGENPHKEQTT